MQIEDPITPYGGNALLRGELDPADARDLETALAARAHQLAQHGCQESLDVRRAMALADLARTQTTLDLTTPGGGTGGFEAQAARRPSHLNPRQHPAARQVVLHVHLSAAVTGDRESAGEISFDRLATLEAGQQQVLLDQVKTWCATSHTAVTIRPVLDLTAQLPHPGYTPNTVLRELVIERDRTCVFPWCSRPARSCQLDHIQPYDPDHPDAQRADHRREPRRAVHLPPPPQDPRRLDLPDDRARRVPLVLTPRTHLPPRPHRHPTTTPPLTPPHGGATGTPGYRTTVSGPSSSPGGSKWS